jgi:hypothetical protein
LGPGSSRVTGYVLQILLNEKLQKILIAQQPLNPGKKIRTNFLSLEFSQFFKVHLPKYRKQYACKICKTLI